MVIMCQKESQLLYYSKSFLELSYEAHFPFTQRKLKIRSLFICPKLTQPVSSEERVCKEVLTLGSLFIWPGRSRS